MNMKVDTQDYYEHQDLFDMLDKLRAAGWLPSEETGTDYGACLPALIHALDVPIELTHICEALPYKRKQISLVDVLNTFANLGYIACPATVKMHALDERLLPCLFVPEKESELCPGAVVVMEKKEDVEDKTEFIAFCGTHRKVINIEVDHAISGTAYFFARQEDVEDVTSETVRSAVGFTWFRSLLERFRGVFWQVFSLSIMVGLVSLAAPLFVMLVYDRVINAHAPEILPPLIVGAGLALLTEWGLRSVRSRLLAWFGARLDNIVSNKVFEQLLLMQPIFTERAGVAAQVSRLKSFETVRDFFTSPLFLAMVEFPFTLVTLLVIAFIAGPVALVPVIVAVLYVVLAAWTRSRFKTAIKLSARASTNRQQMAVESFAKMDSLRASGMTSVWFRQFRDYSGKASLASFRSNYLASVVETIAHGLFIFAGMATVTWGISRVWEEAMTTGALIASMILVWRVLGPFQIFCTSLLRFEQLSNAIDQVNRMMSIDTERNSENIKACVNDLKGDVALSKVGLRYTKDTDPVFTGLTFNAKQGQMVAITGANGSGKSTVLKLINGLYQPQAGTVRVDGVDIRQFDPIELRQNIAYMPQFPHFFQGTISDNLRYADPLATDSELKKVLQKIDAWDDICNMPNGLDTMIGKNHIDLPTALAYRLSLARACIKKTPIMLFDEMPYALLNSSVGEAFTSLIEEWKGKRTIFIVTHREDYLMMADVAILLRNDSPPMAGKPADVIETINKSNEAV